MKKVTLIHAYSDFNKGDLGIILGTIDSLKEVSHENKIQINAVSTFTDDDPFYITHHEFLKKYVNKVYPAIIGRLFSRKKSKLEMIYKLIKDLIKMAFIYFVPINIFESFLFTKSEKRTTQIIRNSDIIISKGGSFICNTPNFIGEIRFLREMSVLILALRLNKKVVIWGQSIGPIYGFISTKVVNYILDKCEIVVLREKDCIKQYPNIRFPKDVIIGYDLAFSLNTNGVFVEKNNNLIGLTVKRFKNKKEDNNYSIVVKKIIEFLTVDLNYKIKIIPQVTIDDDINKAQEIYNTLDSRARKMVLIDTNDYTPYELLKVYGSLSVLIGTRLHSTIFAMCMNTKVINISYHGTKSSGVFSQFNIMDDVLDGNNLKFEELKECFEQIIGNKDISYKMNVQKAKDFNYIIAKKILNETV